MVGFHLKANAVYVELDLMGKSFFLFFFFLQFIACQDPPLLHHQEVSC